MPRLEQWMAPLIMHSQICPLRLWFHLPLIGKQERLVILGSLLSTIWTRIIGSHQMKTVILIPCSLQRLPRPSKREILDQESACLLIKIWLLEPMTLSSLWISRSNTILETRQLHRLLRTRSCQILWEG